MKLVSLNTARVAPLQTAQGVVQSGIAKRPRTGPVAVLALGLEGDEQADPSVHGGIGKAVYAYAHEHYEFWRTVRSQAGVQAWGEALAPGSLGENLTITGLLEQDAHIGDVLRFPDCELAVSEPRFPCFKFNAVMGFKQAAKMMVKSGWCGFYLAVRAPGTIEAGQSFELVPGAREVSIRELFQAKAG